MASIRDHVSAGSGKITYSVTWREGSSQPSRSFGTMREAVAFKREIEQRKRGERALGVRRPARIKYGDWYETWMDEAVSRLTVKVQRQYEGYARRNVLPYFAQTALIDITRDRLRGWVKSMQREGVAVSSINESMVVLRSSLTFAVEEGKLNANPLAGRKQWMPPYRPTRQRPLLTPEQVLALGDAAGPDRLIVLAMGVLALRPGEAIGLRVGDVEGPFLRISRSVTNAAGTMVANPTTKTKKSRLVPLLFLEPDFSARIKAMATLDRDALLFPGRRGGFFHGDTLRVKVRDAGKKIGVALNASDLR
ncbi:MAG: tyrosine recombinase XerC, partial [Actinomycetota bacterium]